MSGVILVMKKEGNIRVMRQALSDIGVDTIGITTPKELGENVKAMPPSSPALIDVSGFGSSVWEMCEMLKENGNPFIVLSTPADFDKGSQTLSLGASSVLQKPVAKTAILQLVQEMVKKSNND